MQVWLVAASLLICSSVAIGAQDSDGTTSFALKAPNAKCVELCGDWTGQNIAMNRGNDGTWSISLPAIPAGVWLYSFAVDGVNVPDPSNPEVAPQRQLKKNVLHVPSVPPAPWDWQDIPHGTVHAHEYLSKALGTHRELLIYTPPGYEREPAKHFPLLVLQHGAGGNQRSWVGHGMAHWILDHLIARKRAVPMLVLMMDGDPLGTFPFGDKERRAKATEAFRRELFMDAIPLVEGNYRVAEGREHRAIAGLSMGGSQALTAGLAAVDRFAWIGAFSSSAGPDAVKPVLETPRETNERLKLLWLACGRDDRFLEGNEAIIGALSRGGIRYQWHLTEGGHTWPLWQRNLVDFVPLLFQH